ncbi:hypothetical protein PL373_13265 [Tenacibaculum maritimum]|nr:hypothetical protein [Tenacibaculum maritimum]MDB0600305.1 hypothetical protein [Tenacibaculum maritimum]MDB0602098.1 hypothetical protein [Tenacibaculum maritimum]MDB0610816.1 hypothetical protein [Tenacibaculum maritimum]
MRLYRYKSNVYSLLDEDGIIFSDHEPKVILEEFIVVRETEKCYFIKVNRKERRVLKTAKSTYAYDTKSKALENYKARCLSNLGHCTSAYEIAKIFFENSKTLKFE